MNSSQSKRGLDQASGIGGVTKINFLAHWNAHDFTNNMIHISSCFSSVASGPTLLMILSAALETV